jgi:hypothetical protein
MTYMHNYVAQVSSQRLASSMLHWSVTDKAAKLMAIISP